jgi:hypothetical protein
MQARQVVSGAAEAAEMKAHAEKVEAENKTRVRSAAMTGAAARNPQATPDEGEEGK